MSHHKSTANVRIAPTTWYHSDGVAHPAAPR